MFLSMNWIQDFVDLSGLDLIKLINQFSLSTAEVENDIFMKGSDLSGIVVGEIKSVEEHPDSKKLHLLKIDAGDDELVDVVCGAPNVRIGLKTAFAKVGAQIGDITIAPRKLAGYTSNGMCCSEAEIGISDDNSGIMEITDDVANGTDLKTIYDIDDIVFEVDNKSLTNRPDLWGHYGIAREFAAISGRPLKDMDVMDLSKYDSLDNVDVKILDPMCQRYSSLKVENITTSVSPVNMRIRLFYAGMRAINFLADMTNYLMLEMGQPMHAFDARKVEKIRIRRFDKPFTFTTLDGVERNIDEQTLMICNDETPVAIAGIMGGLDSEIVDDTTTLTLESATFDAASIRKSTVRLSHRTDASMRYEKSLDPEMTTLAIKRFMKILCDIDKDVKVVSALTDDYKTKYNHITVNIDKPFIDKYTGISIDNDTIIKTLESLGFGVALNEDVFVVDVPSYRATKDISMKADIIEEITRIYGYDNFDIHTTRSPLYPVRPFAEKTVEDKIKDLLVKKFSLHEVHSYVWNYYDELKSIGIDSEGYIKILNATNPNIETIRKSIVPTQLCQVKSNLSYSNKFGIFEIGRVVTGLDECNSCIEKKKLAITLYSKSIDIISVYNELRQIIEIMVGDIKHDVVSYLPINPDSNYQHPKNLNSINVSGKNIGIIGMVHPTVRSKIDKKSSIVFAEIDVEQLTSIDKVAIEYDVPSKYPGIDIDLSFISNKFAPIKEAIETVKSEIIKAVEVTDIYEENGVKSITTRISFQDPYKTLKREDVQEIADRIISDLKEKGINLKG